MGLKKLFFLILAILLLVLIFCTWLNIDKIAKKDEEVVKKIEKIATIVAPTDAEKIKEAISEPELSVSVLDPVEITMEEEIPPLPLVNPAPLVVPTTEFIIKKDKDGTLAIVGEYANRDIATSLESLVSSYGTDTMSFTSGDARLLGEQEWFDSLRRLMPLLTTDFLVGNISYKDKKLSIDGEITEQETMDKLMSVLASSDIEIENKLSFLPQKDIDVVDTVDKTETKTALVTSDTVNGLTSLVKEYTDKTQAPKLKGDLKVALVEHVTRTKIIFATNAVQPNSDQKEMVIKLGQLLKKNPDVKIRIIGHTDARGTRAYNQNLSVKRANRLYNCLRSFGIAKDRLSVVGYGEDKPLVKNNSKENMTKNRRVEFEIIGE